MALGGLTHFSDTDYPEQLKTALVAFLGLTRQGRGQTNTAIVFGGVCVVSAHTTEFNF